MAISETYTWLALDRFASILGIAPPNFNGATCNPYFMASGCQDLFFQHPWQNGGKVSREDIAQAILSAEEDLSIAVGYPLAPTWIAEEVKPYERHYRPEVYQGVYNVRDQDMGLRMSHYKLLAAGVRGLTLIDDDVALTYSDADGDGFLETATVSHATTLTDVQEIKVYHAGHAGEMEWEIRPCRHKAISAGTFTATFWTWQMIDPDLWEEFPESGVDATAIDLSGNPPGNVVSTVDVYREYNDYTQTTARYYWEPKPNDVYNLLGTVTDQVGAHTTQDGCLLIRDPDLGLVAPTMATYDATEDEWTQDALVVGREPDLVKVWYRAGAIDQRYLQGRTYDPLSNQWAKLIAMVATSRLNRDICSCDCGNTQQLNDYWRKDLAVSENGKSYAISFTDLSNPLGTHVGEMEAWKKIKNLRVLAGCPI